jgi:hypothetical protein
MVLLMPLAGVAYWLVVRAELLRAAAEPRPAGAEGGPEPE